MKAFIVVAEYVMVAFEFGHRMFRLEAPDAELERSIFVANPRDRNLSSIPKFLLTGKLTRRWLDELMAGTATNVANRSPSLKTVPFVRSI